MVMIGLGFVACDVNIANMTNYIDSSILLNYVNTLGAYMEYGDAIVVRPTLPLLRNSKKRKKEITV